MFAQFKTLPQLFDYFKDEETCLIFWENVRWSETGILCPHCGGGNPYKTNRGYKCKNLDCQKKFSALVGSIFENSKLPLRTWFGAIYLCSNHKKGISSLQLGRDLGIHQSSAWFLLHRIREAFKMRTFNLIGGSGSIVEADTTVVGGKAKNLSNKKRKEIAEKKRGAWDNKTNINGIIERSGEIRFEVLNDGVTESNIIEKHIDKESVLMTDSANSYKLVGSEFASHSVVNHSVGEYCIDGVVHTNTIEGAFSHFDRMVIGTYHNISKKHMQSYANECAYRYNSRKLHVVARFEDTVMKCSGVRLKYETLIGK